MTSKTNTTVATVITLMVGLSSLALYALPIPQSTQGCTEIKKQFNPDGKAPVVSGKTVDIPGFWIRLLDSKTRIPLPNREVGIAYGWSWWKYSSEDDTWDWYPAGDLLDCRTD